MLRLVALAAAAVWMAACQGPGVPSSEFTGEPMALLWFDEASARRRSESLAAELEKPVEKGRNTRATNRAVAQFDDVADYIEGLIAPNRGEKLEDQGQLALLDPGSGDIEVVEGALRGAIPMQWSSDHTRLLFTQVIDVHPKLYELNVVSGEVNPLTYGRQGHPEGCYGPNGSIVVTEVNVESGRHNASIVLIEPGGRRTQLSPPGMFASFPTCAPDGSSVVYVAFRARGPARLVSHAPVVGSEPRILGPGRDPSFTPDGQWVVYTALEGRRRWELWRMRPDGTGRTRVGRGDLDEIRPTVSPDGKLVAYVAERNYRTLLYLRRFDGSGDRILLGDGSIERPVW